MPNQPSQARLSITVDKEDIEWFKSTYPADSQSWLFTMLLKEFKRAHNMTPSDYAAIGARELKKGISGL